MKLGCDIKTLFQRFKNNYKNIWKTKEMISQDFIFYPMINSLKSWPKQMILIQFKEISENVSNVYLKSPSKTILVILSQ